MKFDNQFNTEYNVPTNIRGQVKRNLFLVQIYPK